MEQLTLFDDLEPQDNGLLGTEAIESLGAIDREQVKLQILNAVNSCVTRWNDPIKPATTFYKVNGRVLCGVINGYTMRPYTNAANILSLLSYVKFCNEKYGTNYSPVFVPTTLVKSKGWKMKADAVDSPCNIFSSYWQRETDEKTIKKLEERYRKKGITKTYLYVRLEENVWVYRSIKCSKVVFAQDIEGDPIKVEAIEVPEAKMIEYVENILIAAKDNVAPVVHDEIDRCYYKYSEDKIHLVNPKWFENIYEYYSTRFHESAHSTMSPKRTGRSEIFHAHLKEWGDEYYANEELVAEISAFILCGELGLSYYAKAATNVKDEKTGNNSIAYIADWVNKAKDLYFGDKEKAILTAHGYACQAVDYILKGIDLAAMIPDSIKQLEDEDAHDNIEYQGDNFRVEHSKEAERFRVFFSSVPSQEVRTYMKKHGFHYSAQFVAWQVKDDDKGRAEINELIRLYGTASKPQPTAPTTTNNRLRLIKIQAAAKLKLQQQRMRKR